MTRSMANQRRRPDRFGRTNDRPGSVRLGRVGSGSVRLGRVWSLKFQSWRRGFFQPRRPGVSPAQRSRGSLIPPNA